MTPRLVPNKRVPAGPPAPPAEADGGGPAAGGLAATPSARVFWIEWAGHALLALAVCLAIGWANRLAWRHYGDPGLPHLAQFLTVTGPLALFLPVAGWLLPAFCLSRRGSVPSAVAEMGTYLTADLFILLATGLAWPGLAVLLSGQSLEDALRLVFVAGALVRASLPVWAVWRRSGGGDRGDAWRLLSSVAALYVGLALWNGSAVDTHGDEPHYLMMTHSIVHDRDLNQWNNYQEKAYTAFFRGQLSPKPSDRTSWQSVYTRGLGIVLPLLLAPSYWLGGYLGITLTMAGLAILLSGLTLHWLQRIFGRGRSAVFAWFAASLCQPLVIYATKVYPDVPAGILLVAGLLLLEDAPQTGGWWTAKRRLAGAAGCAAALLLLKARFLPLTLSLFLLIGLRLRASGRRWRLLGAGAAGVFLAVLAFDYFVLAGDIFFFRFGRIEQIVQFLPGWSAVGRLLGLGWDQESGLFVMTPAFLMAFASLAAGKTGEFRRRGLRLLLVAGPYVIALTGHWTWHSLPTPPCRYLVPLLAPLAGLLALGYEQWMRHRRGGFPALLLGLSLAHAGLLLSIPAWQHNQADGTNAAFEALGSALGVCVSCLFPSWTRTRWMTWIVSAALLAVLAASGKARPRTAAGAPLWIAAALAIIGILVGAAPQWSAIPWIPRAIELEDMETVHHDGGRPFPYPKDPFFHRQADYGWELLPETSVTVTWNMPPGEGLIIADVRGLTADDRAGIRVRYGETEVPGLLLAAAGDWQPAAIPWNSPPGEGRLVLEPWCGRGQGRPVISRLIWWPAAPAVANVLRRVSGLFNNWGGLARSWRAAACLSAGPAAWSRPEWQRTWTALLADDLKRSRFTEFAVWHRIWQPADDQLAALCANLDDRERVITARTLLHYGCPTAARLLLEPLLPRNTAGVEVNILMARIAREAGQPQRALNWLRKALIEEGMTPAVAREIDLLRESVAATVERQDRKLQVVTR